MDDVDCMRVFLRVAELSSFTTAAKTLGVPKASVSQAVQQLEARVGVRLLHRTTRRVSLTQDGLVFSERARDLVTDLDELTSLFQDERSEVSGRLRVDMPVGAARRVVIPRLPEFLAVHPELEVEISATDRISDPIREGFDLVLRVGTRGDSSLIVRHLGYYPVISCVSAAYAERRGVPKTLEDLSEHRLVHYASVLGSAPDPFEYVNPETGNVETVKVAGSVTVNSAASYLAACRAGLGIVQVPKIGVQEELASGELIQILPEYLAPALPVSLLYPNRRHQPRRVRVFMEWLVSLFESRVVKDPMVS